MQILRRIPELKKIIKYHKDNNRRVGFVPTMGALHNGHLALIRQANNENDITVLSIFVNPIQFAPGEDFRIYPRDKKNDIFLAKQEKVDIIFYPSVKSVYPDRYLTYINVDSLSEVLCGKSRRGHFRGVATVVAKLLNIVNPDYLYLGQKDAQQCAVVGKMIKDLNFSVKLRTVPTVREQDGLAISSRNKYLTNKQRIEACALYHSLKFARNEIRSGQHDSLMIRKSIRSHIQKNTSGRIDFIECVDALTLIPIDPLKGKVLIALAVWFGKARLIDNITVNVKN